MLHSFEVKNKVSNRRRQKLIFPSFGAKHVRNQQPMSAIIAGVNLPS